MITFKANCIGQTTVKRIERQDRYVDFKASFVELDATSKNDKMVLSELHEDWGPADKYSQDIYGCFLEKYYHPDCFEGSRFFALTKQSKNFEKLRKEDILGVAQVSKDFDDDINIDYLQTNPEYMVHSNYRNYKGIGSALLGSIEQCISKGNIKLVTLPSVIGFYEKLGYKLQNRLGSMIKNR